MISYQYMIYYYYKELGQSNILSAGFMPHKESILDWTTIQRCLFISSTHMNHKRVRIMNFSTIKTAVSTYT